MKKYRHTRRSAILFLILTPLTILIYPIVVLCHVGKEVNRIYEGQEGYKKSMHFFGAFLLGFITLGIVPIVWLCRVAGKIGRAAKANGIVRPSVSGPAMFFLTIFFGALVVTLIIGWCKFFHTLNALERKLNADMAAKAAEEAQEDIIAPEADETASEPFTIAEAAPEEAVVSVAAPEAEPETVPEAEAEPEAIPEPEPEEPKEEEPAPFDYVTETPAPEPKPEERRSDVAAIYHVAGRNETRKWRVRVADENQPVKLFDSQEEALAYAKGLATRKRATVRVKK